MMKGSVAEESMSNLTCASGEVSASSGSRIEADNMYTQQSFAGTTNQLAPQAKKKRNLPGNPDPNAEVIALSPKTLLATNRFICEICNKGFQRDQNLQLHKRGHNLPWKLKQRTSKEERKKVYVCPESTCVHHDPSRALGDLTGIKKHFSRKHGEKKWKCEKCSKIYAVQSDWKAHSKICGTREYRCDCGKVFSRRDSFITHRAFCDVLAKESARAMTTNPLLSCSQQFGASATHMLSLPSQPQISHGLQALSSVKREQNQPQIFNSRPDINNIPTWLVSQPDPCPLPLDLSSSPLFSGSSLSLENHSPNPNATGLNTALQPLTSSPHMSATALLQKAAQMGVTMSKPSPLPVATLRPHQAAHMSQNITAAGLICSTEAASTAGSGLVLSSREELASGFAHALASFGNKATVTAGFMEQFAAGSGAGAAPSLVHDMMTSLSPVSGLHGSSSFDEALNYGVSKPTKYTAFQETLTRTTGTQVSSKNDHENRASHKGGSDSLTRDFLGLKAFPQRDFINILGLDYVNAPPPPPSSTYAEQNQNQRP